MEGSDDRDGIQAEKEPKEEEGWDGWDTTANVEGLDTVVGQRCGSTVSMGCVGTT